MGKAMEKTESRKYDENKFMNRNSTKKKINEEKYNEEKIIYDKNDEKKIISENTMIIIKNIGRKKISKFKIRRKKN